MKQQSNSLNCGDINLAAALMSVAIPLDQLDPCSIVLRDNGRNYARFHVMPQSVDGAYQTERLFQFWKNSEECNDAEFSAIMDFVKHGRKEGAVTAQDWFNIAHSYLENMQAIPPNAPAKINDIPDYIANNNTGAASHIFAFAYNREHCWQVMQQAKRRIMISKGKAHASIDSNLAAWKRNEILARLEG